MSESTKRSHTGLSHILAKMSFAVDTDMFVLYISWCLPVWIEIIACSWKRSKMSFPRANLLALVFTALRSLERARNFQIKRMQAQWIQTHNRYHAWKYMVWLKGLGLWWGKGRVRATWPKVVGLPQPQVCVIVSHISRQGRPKLAACNIRGTASWSATDGFSFLKATDDIKGCIPHKSQLTKRQQTIAKHLPDSRSFSCCAQQQQSNL